MTQNYDNIQNNEKKIPLDIEGETLDSSLRAALYRQDCPDSMTLSEYHLGISAEPEAAHLAAHLDHCPYCQAEIGRLAEFLAEEMPVATPVDEDSNWILGDGFRWQHLKRAGKVIIQIEEALDTAISNLQQGLTPSTVPLTPAGPSRGRQPLFELHLKEGIEDFEAVIFVETSWADPTNCAIRVEVNTPSRGGWPNLADTEVALKKDEVTVDIKVTDKFGHAIFEKIPTDELTQLGFEITPRS